MCVDMCVLLLFVSLYTWRLITCCSYDINTGIRDVQGQVCEYLMFRGLELRTLEFTLCFHSDDRVPEL